jgi:hypothetical protein
MRKNNYRRSDDNNNVKCTERLLARFGLVIRFTEHLQLVTKSNNNSSWIYTVYNSLWHALGLISPLCFHQSFGNGFQRRTYSFLWDPELSSCLRPQRFSYSNAVCLTVAAMTLVHSDGCCTCISLSLPRKRCICINNIIQWTTEGSG